MNPVGQLTADSGHGGQRRLARMLSAQTFEEWQPPGSQEVLDGVPVG